MTLELALDQAWLIPAFAIAAALYSAVGHGGASAYLALGALAGFSRTELVPMALLLNIVVAGIAAWNYRAHLQRELLIPLALASVPAAFLGARVGLSQPMFSALLGLALLWSALRIVLLNQHAERPTTPMTGKRKWLWAPTTGLSIGALSGMLGIGGGVLLTPVALLLRWSNVKQAAAVSAAFIVLNSLSGFVSFAAQGHTPQLSALPFLLAAGVGGLLGSRLGARRLSSRAIRGTLGFVLAFAAVKLIAVALEARS